MQEENSIGKYLMVAFLIGGAFFFSQGSRKEIPLPKDSEFVGRVTNSVPVIVKFGAEWCPPCRHVELELDRLTHMYGNRVRVVKIDVDAQPELAGYYRIGSIPHLMLFHYGKQIKEIKGARSAEELAEWAGIK
jgi:thioredoxin 1